MKIFDKIKLLFKDKEPEKVVVHFNLPSSNCFDVGSDGFLDYHRELKCKKHWDYHGLAVPTNNCNECWEYYLKKVKK